MSSPEVIYACRCLIRDTFRQAKANYIFWVMLGASALVIFFCLSLHIEKGQPLTPKGEVGYDIGHPRLERPKLPAHGHMTLAFGAWRIELFRDGQAQIHFMLLLLAEWVAGGGGTLLALIWTAGFVPDFLQPAQATVLLSKPISRWVLLTGKYLSVLVFAGFQVTVFIFGTYLACGLSTGFWVDSYLWGIPLLLLHFAAVYSFSVLLAVCTRSTLACVIGSTAFWLLCWGMNYGRHRLVALEEHMPPVHAALRGLVDIGYWILPKPVDMGMILHRALDAGRSFSFLDHMEEVRALGAFYPELSMLTSVLFAIGMIVVATQQLAATDY